MTDPGAATWDEQLARRYPGPVYVYDLDRVAAAAGDLRAALPAPSLVYYSLKANPHDDVVRALRTAGCRAEISSTGELAGALGAGFRGAECLYTGPGKTDGEIAHAVRHGVLDFSVESVHELRRIDRIAAAQGRRAGVLLRVNGERAAPAGGMHMTGSPSQFGIDVELLGPAVAAAAGCPAIDLTGLHLFSMTNAVDEPSLIRELRRSITTAAAVCERYGLAPRMLDLGGGFAAPYTQSGRRPGYPGLAQALRQELDLRFPGWSTGAPAIAFESGRYLVADCGTLICTVTEVKNSRGKQFIVLDAGINALGGLSGTGRLLPLSVEPVGMPRAAGTSDGAQGVGPAMTSARVVGPLCTPADLLGRDVPVPRLRPGDRIAIPNVGAYGLTTGLLGFLGRPAPTELVVRGRSVVSASRLELIRVPVDREWEDDAVG
ncbi:type III PLP-dependent enzyme [Streptomyces sp. NPDC054765]